MKPTIHDIVGQTIRVNNDLANDAPKTFLTNQGTAGSSVIDYDNSSGLSVSWALQFGETGEERSEVKLLGTAALAATKGTLTTNLSFDHPADTPIYGILYDQVVFGTAVGTTGTTVDVAGGTITYQPDSEFTIFNHTAGSSTLGYRVYFRNSVTTGSSALSDWLMPAGFDFYSLAALRERGREKLWNTDWLTDTVANNWVNECKDMMVNKVIQTNEDYTLGTENVAFGTDGLGTISTADFSQLRRVWITYNGVDKFQSTKMNINDFLPTQYFSSAHPYHSFKGDGVIQVKPSDSLGTAELVFYRFGTTMVNDTDVLPLPMRPYTHIFTEFFKAQALTKDEKFAEGNTAMGRVDALMSSFALDMGARDKSGPTMIDIVESVTGDETWIT